MAEKEHILDTILNTVRESLTEEVKIFLARDEEDNEVLAIETKDWQKGLSIDQLVHSYGTLRIYQADSEEEAIDQLASSIKFSIDNMLKEELPSDTEKEDKK
jgi:hypothetical protein